MADDKSKRGPPDRRKVAGGEDYEVRHLAKKFGISLEAVRKLIAKYGNNRIELEKAAAKLKK